MHSMVIYDKTADFYNNYFKMFLKLMLIKKYINNYKNKLKRYTFCYILSEKIVSNTA